MQFYFYFGFGRGRSITQQGPRKKEKEKKEKKTLFSFHCSFYVYMCSRAPFPEPRFMLSLRLRLWKRLNLTERCLDWSPTRCRKLSNTTSPGPSTEWTPGCLRRKGNLSRGRVQDVESAVVMSRRSSPPPLLLLIGPSNPPLQLQSLTRNCRSTPAFKLKL